jgi:hypothetical protein
MRLIKIAAFCYEATNLVIGPVGARRKLAGSVSGGKTVSASDRLLA